ncbi:MAG: GNAT family N-acetyltransferase [Cellvibrionaceae bacterium]
MSYKLEEKIPSVDDYIQIRLAAGLSKKSIEAASKGLPNSIYAVTVYHENIPIGIGRIVGDGGCFYEITDIAVIPKHQKKGVGVMIMEALVSYLNDNAPSTAYVSLMADHGTPHFYEKFGFTLSEMPKSSGMYMRIS